MASVKYFHNRYSKSQLFDDSLHPKSFTILWLAFFAYIWKDFWEAGMLHVFVYGTEVTNQGNGYSKHTGAFAALSPGIYDFCYMAFALGEHVAKDYGEVSVQLVYNGAYQCSIYVDTETNWEDAASQRYRIDQSK